MEDLAYLEKLFLYNRVYLIDSTNSINLEYKVFFFEYVSIIVL